MKILRRMANRLLEILAMIWEPTLPRPTQVIEALEGDIQMLEASLKEVLEGQAQAWRLTSTARKRLNDRETWLVNELREARELLAEAMIRSTRRKV